MAAIDGHGTTLHYKTTEGGAAYGDAIIQVTSITGGGISRGMIETTHMTSTSRSHIPAGFYEGQEISLDIQYDPDAATHSVFTTAITAASPTEYIWKISYTDSTPTTYEINGYVSGFEVTAEMEDLLTASVTIRTTGDVTIT